jgi:hypothetical protein
MEKFVDYSVVKVVKEYVAAGGTLIGLGDTLKTEGIKASFSLVPIAHHEIKDGGKRIIICNKNYVSEADYVFGEVAIGVIN